jgi:hypothetical protein
MLGDDIYIDQAQGDWLGFDFDHESLNFTAEFVGPVTAEQVRDFNAAFDGTTSLRRATIAQFAHITDAIEEDELIGFGLYLDDAGTEPGEWRCLSRRDALRIAEEIRLLIGESEELAPQSHLPAVSDSSSGARLFSERRDRALEPAKWMGAVRQVEQNLTRRIGKLEIQVGDHGAQLEELTAKSSSSEASIGRLVSAVEGFCEQATRRLETLPAPALPTPPAPPLQVTMPALFRWRSTLVISVVAGLALLALTLLLWPSRSEGGQKTLAAAPVEQAPEKKPASSPPAVAVSVPAKASPEPQASEQPRGARIDLEATEPTWISVTEEDGHTLMSAVLEPNASRGLNLVKNAVLRAGNAGGLTILFNGKTIGPIGPHGRVRDVEFKNGTYRLVEPAK